MSLLRIRELGTRGLHSLGVFAGDIQGRGSRTILRDCFTREKILCSSKDGLHSKFWNIGDVVFV